MRFLATGDMHVFPYQQFSHIRKDGMNSRLYNCLRVFPIIKAEAIRRKIDKVLINGDLFHESNWINVEVFDAVYRRLEELHDASIQTVINLGQHDISRTAGGRVLHALRAFRKVATIVEEPKLVWKHLQVLPWTDSADTLKQQIRDLQTGPEYCLALHCGVQGARTGPNDFIVPNSLSLRDIRAKSFGLVLLSDYHTRQKLARNTYYLGSPIQHSFGEIHRPCIWDISIGGRDGNPRLAKIFTPFPQFRRVTGSNWSEIKDRAKDWAGDYVEIFAGPFLQEEQVKRFADRIGFKYSIKHRTEEQIEMQDSRSFNINEVMKDYVKQAVKPDRKRLLSLGSRLYEGESV